MTATKLDIFKAEAEIKTAAADIISRILEANTIGASISPDQFFSLGCTSLGISRAVYHMTALKRFSIMAELTETYGAKKPVKFVVSVDDGVSHHRTSKTFKV